MLLEKGHVFLLKRFGPMMRSLFGEVFLYRFTIGHTHRESGISWLPTEILDANGFVNPTRRGLFAVLNELSQRMRCPQTNQQMNMVSDTAYGFWHTARCAN